MSFHYVDIYTAGKKKMIDKIAGALAWIYVVAPTLLVFTVFVTTKSSQLKKKKAMATKQHSWWISRTYSVF